MITATVNIEDSASPDLRRRMAALTNPTKINAEMAMAVETKVRRHLRETKALLPNKLGAPSTGFWQQAISSTRVSSSREGGLVEVRKRGVALLYYGGTVRPVKAKALTIPIAPEAHGKRVGDFPAGSVFRIPSHSGDPDTVGVLARRIGTGRGAALQSLYVLRTKAEIPPDPSILPTDKELADAAAGAAQAFLERPQP